MTFLPALAGTGGRHSPTARRSVLQHSGRVRADLPWDKFAIGTSYFFGAFAPGTPTLFGFIDGEWWAAQVNTTNDGFVGGAEMGHAAERRL